jgi:HK97 family phage portal protein
MNWLKKTVLTIAAGVGLTDPRLLGMFGGGMRSHAGKVVTVDTAMQISTVWACIRLLSSTIATLPLGIYKTDADGGKTVQRDHPLYTLLHDQPNADMTAAEFWEAMLGALLVHGNAFAEKAFVRTSAKDRSVIALTPLRSDKMKVRRAPGGALVFTYTDGGTTRDIPEDSIFHLKGFSLDGLVGLSPIAQARHSMGLALAAEEVAGKFFANGMRAPGVFTYEKFFKDEPERVRMQAIVKAYQGILSAGEAPLLEGGLDFKALQISPQDAQLLATREFGVAEICRWYGVPPHMVGHLTNSTSWGTGLEQQMIAFLIFSLSPYLKKIEQSVRKSLITAADRAGGLYAEFNLDGLLRADSAGRAALYATYSQNGVATRNEIRGRENWPKMPGGDMLTVQSNLVRLDSLGEVPAGAVSDAQKAREALRNFLCPPGEAPAVAEQRLREIIAEQLKQALMGHNGGPPLGDS